jgi:1-acyl-sn-glycerol-3-phosphate acyltransferase
VLRAFSVAYWVFVALTMPVFFSVALVVFLATIAFDRRRVALHLYSCFWASCYVYLNPLWRCRVEGRERLPWRGPAVIVANHASMVDILVLYGLYRPFKWVSKASIFKVPFVGWNMVINGYVSLERGDRDSIKAMMGRCRELLGQGSPVLLFPEGTRTPNGRMQEFRAGAFRLAREAGCPVVPVAVTGTFDTLPKHGLVLRNRMDARVRVLEPLDARSFPSADALREAAQAAIRASLGEAGPTPAGRAAAG